MMDEAAIKARSDALSAQLRAYLARPPTYLIEAVRNSNLESEHKEEIVDLINTIPDTMQLILRVTERADAIDRNYPLPEGGAFQ